MSWQPEIDELHRRRKLAEACGGPEAVRCLDKATKKKLSPAQMAGVAHKCCCTKIPVLPPKPDKKPEEEAPKPDGQPEDAKPEDAKPEENKTE